ncbi:hypothetical protein LJ737_18970 [Hymenobacter sp. 15J16-1T3B]|uniref:hypothetical protein n=1 Tax=Hymenobacter sp. 15J16-1T3B TaxID=2886941 RepID=UPI001D0FB7B4|nr:hypothetical protein [Hymenobacter sp. 15J16-1T3B]MCC3159332.1 hypothetical protein [Hymenobacter sp. 15J16-1T3B]
MAQHHIRRSDDFDDRRSQHPHHDDRRGQDRFGDNYDSRRSNENWRDEPRDEYGRFQRRDEQPQRNEADDRRRHQEDDDRRRGFRTYGDYAGSDRGRGYGPGRMETGGADYARGYDNDDNRRQTRDQHSRGYRPEGTSGYLQDRRSDDRDDSRRRGYDDARNLPARGDFDRGANRSSQDYRDDYTRRPERRDDAGHYDGRRDQGQDERRSRYDGSNRDGARSDYGYGDDYSSSLYDPNSRNSAFRRRDDEDRDRGRGQADRGRRWSDTPDLDNQPRR